MSNVRCPMRGAHVVLLALSLLAAIDHATGQQMLCTPTDPTSCPQDYYCDSNNICVPVKATSDNTTTYVILGCVLGGVTIIAIVIVILYCGKWSWLVRLRSSFAGKKTAAPPPTEQPPYQPQYQPQRVNWAQSIRNKIKLKFGGPRRNPYTSSQSVAELSSTTVTPPANNNLQSQQTIETRYFVGQDGTTSLSPGDQKPYVATVEVSGSEPAPPVSGSQYSNQYSNQNVQTQVVPAQYSNQNVQTQVVPAQYSNQNVQTQAVPAQYSNQAGPVIPIHYSAPNAQAGRVMPADHQLGNPYLSGSRHSLNSPDPVYRQEAHVAYQPVAYPSYSPQPSPQLMRPQINIRSPIPTEPANEPVVPPQPTITPAVLEPAPANVVPHTHQVYQSLYPSLGYGHTHEAPSSLPTYREVPAKY